MGEAERDQAAVPLLARLVLEQLRHAVRPDPGGQTRRRERQQGRKRIARRAHGHGMPRQGARQPHRFDAEFGLHQRLARGGRVAFVEHQIERGADRLRAFGQRLRWRRLDGDVGRLELPAGAHQALGDGGRLAQHAGRDLRHGEAAHRLQRKGHAHFGRQGGVADGEQQCQLVVVQLAIEAAVVLSGRGSQWDKLLGKGCPARFATQQVERAVPGDGGEPGLGPFRHTLERPQRQRLQERVLDGILGNGDAARAQPPRQRRDQPMGRIARQRGDEAVDLAAQPTAFALAGASAAVIRSMGRSSTQLVAFHRCGQSRAMASASASSLASITK